jgi:hypothetical protein
MLYERRFVPRFYGGEDKSAGKRWRAHRESTDLPKCGWGKRRRWIDSNWETTVRIDQPKSFRKC